MGHDDAWSDPMNQGKTEPPRAAISEVPADGVDVPKDIPPLSAPVRIVVVEETSPSSTVADWETEGGAQPGRSASRTVWDVGEVPHRTRCSHSEDG
jgi:hypothetical protein